MVSSELEESFDIVALLSGSSSFFHFLESEQNNRRTIDLFFFSMDNFRGVANIKEFSPTDFASTGIIDMTYFLW